MGGQPEPGKTALLMETMPVLAKQIQQWLGSDPALARVRDDVEKGWPGVSKSEEIKAYFARKTELSVLDGCILWGARVVTPPQARKVLLRDLRNSHPGINRMKSLPRSYLWWPKRDSDIEVTVHHCDTCQTHRGMPSGAPLHSRKWSSRP